MVLSWGNRKRMIFTKAVGFSKFAAASLSFGLKIGIPSAKTV